MKPNIRKLYLIRFLANCSFVAAVLPPFFTNWSGIFLSRVLWFNAWFMICIFLFETPTGSVADFLSSTTSILLGCGLAGCGYLRYVQILISWYSWRRKPCWAPGGACCGWARS